MNITDKQNSIIQEFAGITDWQNKYKLIIQKGKDLSSMPEESKTADNIVKGCQSQVWLASDFNKQDKTVIFTADSDAMIVKGLISLLLYVYSGETPDNIIKYPPIFIEKIGMQDHLSITRKNGLDRIIKQIQFYAIAYQSLLSR